jgi:AraC family transcriptional regulator, arabinose operon regulatory protein
MKSPQQRGGYSSPFTRHGTALNQLTRAGLATFRIHECGYSGSLRWHHPGVLSPFWRLYYNSLPGWRVHHAGVDYPIGPDRVVLIADGLHFDCIGEHGVPHLWIHFNSLQPARLAPKAPITLPLSAPLHSAVDALLAAHAEAPEPTLARLYHRAAALLHAAFAELDHPAPTEHPARLDQLLRFIDQHLGDDLSNPRLARRVALSESAFIRWFRQHLQITPSTWVQQVRVQQAAQLLVLSDLSIEQISADCGFPNRFYFSRVFRQRMSCGPAEYRKRQAP